MLGKGRACPLTRLKAPTPSFTPPSKCLWFSPLQYCEDCTRLSSSLQREAKPVSAPSAGRGPLPAGAKWPPLLTVLRTPWWWMCNCLAIQRADIRGTSSPISHHNDTPFALEFQFYQLSHNPLVRPLGTGLCSAFYLEQLLNLGTSDSLGWITGQFFVQTWGEGGCLAHPRKFSSIPDLYLLAVRSSLPQYDKQNVSGHCQMPCARETGPS